MYCRQCGYNNDPYSKVCHRCGSIMREAEDLYDRENDEQQNGIEAGVLKYARKSEDIVSILKSPFRRLERANRKQKFSILAIICAAAVVLCLAVWIGALSIKACSRVEETVYGNTPANIAQNAIAATDGSFIYFSCPFGNNPGLYRMSVSTGETLKISYMCMECLNVAGNWIYGITGEGIVMRISTDGLTSQPVVDDMFVRQMTVVDDSLYYIGRECLLRRADLTTLTKRSTARTEQIGSSRMTEFIVYNDEIYYIALSEEEYNELFTFSEVRYYEPEEDGNKDGKKDSKKDKEKEKEENSYVYTEFRTPNGADIPVHAGCIWRMDLDGTEATELLGTPVEKLTAADGYMYFQSEAILTVSATDVDPNAPEGMMYDMPTTKCWRLELDTLKYSSVLDIHVASSPMNPGEDGWIYYITADKTLERTTSAGKERFDVLTYEQTVDRIAVVGSRIYALCNGETRLISLDCTDGSVDLLCEKAEEPATESEDETDGTQSTDKK